MNNLVTDKNSFSYDGRIFEPVVFGHEQGFLSRLLNYISNNNFDNSVDYIMEEVDKNLKSFNDNSVGEDNRKEYRKIMFNFLKVYPKHSLSKNQSDKIISFTESLSD